MSELSTVIHPSWVALHGMSHSFIELDKAVIHVISLVSFLCLWFSVCLPSDGQLYGAGAAAVRRWSGHEETSHVEGQRSPSKMVGTGAVAAQCWSHCKEIPHIQGQRRSPSKMGEEVNSCLDQTPFHQRHPEGSNKPCVHQDPETPQRLSQNCV